jgi:hypothetical protein
MLNSGILEFELSVNLSCRFLAIWYDWTFFKLFYKQWVRWAKVDLKNFAHDNKFVFFFFFLFKSLSPSSLSSSSSSIYSPLLDIDISNCSPSRSIYILLISWRFRFNFRIFQVTCETILRRHLRSKTCHSTHRRALSIFPATYIIVIKFP